MTQPSQPRRPHPGDSLVLYCLIARKGSSDSDPEYLLIDKQGHPTFPPTKFRAGESLYDAMVRPLKEDLKLTAGRYFPEEELPAILNSTVGPRYPDLPADWHKQWHLYPVSISLDAAARASLQGRTDVHWWTLGQVLAECKEPNVLAIAQQLQARPYIPRLIEQGPSMDALASDWAAAQSQGVRILRSADIRSILAPGDRAFNIRVADPYLPYHRQGLGFTWSFFTPKDGQDVHVHGLPAVEIYGIIEGRLQLWSKPMNERGVRTWTPRMLGPGDWAEVEPLNCHFACWLESEGLGVVVKAAGPGTLAGKGRLGTAGKTICQDCSMKMQCQIPQNLTILMEQYHKPFDQRDFDLIARKATQAM